MAKKIKNLISTYDRVCTDAGQRPETVCFCQLFLVPEAQHRLTWVTTENSSQDFALKIVWRHFQLSGNMCIVFGVCSAIKNSVPFLGQCRHTISKRSSSTMLKYIFGCELSPASLFAAMSPYNFKPFQQHNRFFNCKK